MKKRMIMLSMVLIASITLVSCDSTNIKLNPQYSNDITKGNDVSSITIDYYDSESNSNDQIIIASSDSYQEMIDKLKSAGYYYNYGIRNNDGKTVIPYCETLDSREVIEVKNSFENKMYRDEKGAIARTDGEYTCADISYDHKYVSNVTAYDNTFYMCDSIDCSKTIINSRDGNFNSNSKTEELNKGVYCNYQGDSDNGSIELATDMSPTRIFMTYGNNNLLDDYAGLYCSMQWQKDSYKEQVYKAKDSDITYSTNNIKNFQIQTTTQSYYRTNRGESYYNVAKLVTDIPDNYKDYYEVSFELTDKYLIIKNKIKTQEEIITNNTYSDKRRNERFIESEGSYTYREVWINYKSLIKNGNKYIIGYDYYKEDLVSCTNNTMTYDKSSYSSDRAEKLVELGLDGKTWTMYYVTEIHFNTYVIDIDDTTITEKKESFIKKCKDNNYFNSHEFYLYATTVYF